MPYELMLIEGAQLLTLLVLVVWTFFRGQR